MSRPVLRYGVLPLSIVTAIAAAYGGWATITVETLPGYVVAGKTTNLTFAVRQHGEDLLSNLQPRLEMRSGSSAKQVLAVRTNRDGYYTAALNVPAAGQWDVTIHSGFGKSKLELLPITAIRNGAQPVAFTHQQRGRQLFAAKGCVSCHTHAQVSGSGTYDVGPDLTERRLASDYLEKFLANPAIKRATPGKPRMPNLELKPAEIAALVAFVNGDGSAEVAAKR